MLKCTESELKLKRDSRDYTSDAGVGLITTPQIPGYGYDPHQSQNSFFVIATEVWISHKQNGPMLRHQHSTPPPNAGPARGRAGGHASRWEIKEPQAGGDGTSHRSGGWRNTEHHTHTRTHTHARTRRAITACVRLVRKRNSQRVTIA